MDRSKGELHVLGRRHIAIDGEALCSHLDRLCGSKVAEVIIHQHEYGLGMEDAEGYRRAKPNATIHEIVKVVEEEHLVSGFGITEVRLPNDTSRLVQPIPVEIFNPCVRTTSGAGSAILTAYWCGVMAFLLGRHVEAHALTYDPTENSIKFDIVVRG